MAQNDRKTYDLLVVWPSVSEKDERFGFEESRNCKEIFDDRSALFGVAGLSFRRSSPLLYDRAGYSSR